jgi:hypothetical protein
MNRSGCNFQIHIIQRSDGRSREVFCEAADANGWVDGQRDGIIAQDRLLLRSVR